MKLLLQTCCGPCMTAFGKYFNDNGIDFSAYFYNPNIHPYKEYLKRLVTLTDYATKEGIPLLIRESFMQSKWENNFKNLPAEKRCRNCYEIRLESTAKAALENGFTHFTSTLLISPYQNHELIKEIGEQLAVKYGVSFYYNDFRSMFREGQNIAREKNLYRQKYCGCIYSLEESKFKSKISWD